MDSLLANYASSDEEEEHEPKQKRQSTSSASKPISLSSSSQKASSLFSSLPQPKSSSLFSSLPQPQKNPIKKTPTEDDDSRKRTSNSNKSSPFASLPPPKFQTQKQPLSLEKPTKKVVRIVPPSIKSNNFDDEDDDEEEAEKERKKRKESQYLDQSSSVKSFLSSIPAPKSSATLGILHSNQGSGRRSIIETEASASSSSDFEAKNESSTDENAVNYQSYELGNGQNAVDYANYYQHVENYTNYQVGEDQNVGNFSNYGSYQTVTDQNVHSGDASNYVNYETFNGYGDNGQYGSGTTVQETAGVFVSGARMPRKRGKNEIPAEIVEVKQDELMKDKPREDQVKLTGIAFGPSYQPASTKGKPTKLHKRKHQIGSLYFDMKQKEMELAERRSRGLLTKAQTQGKYGW